MKQLLKQIRRVGLFGFVAIFSLSVFMPLLIQGQVSAQEAAPSFIDRLYVQYDGDTWGNPNPYNKGDGVGSIYGGFTYIRGWRVGDSRDANADGSPKDCVDYMRVNDLDSTPKADVVFRSKNTFDECRVTGRSAGLVMERTDKKFVNAYRRDADNIFTPQGFQSDNVGGCGLSTYDSFDLLLPGSTNFRRPPAGDRPGDRPNRYYKIQSDGVLDDNIFLDTEGGVDAKVKLQIAGCGVVPGIERTFDQVVLANNGEAVSGEAGNCIPRVESPPSKACPSGDDSDPTDPGGSGGTGDTAVDECEDKASEEGGWGWVICPMLEYIDNTANDMLSKITDLLTLSKTDFDGKGDSEGNLQVAWSYFRNIASFALIIIGLVMVIGQATSGE